MHSVFRKNPRAPIHYLSSTLQAFTILLRFRHAKKVSRAAAYPLNPLNPFASAVYLCSGKSERPAPAELPQDRKVARVGGCSGAILACFFLSFRVGPEACSVRQLAMQ
jgi:hypothetical protein